MQSATCEALVPAEMSIVVELSDGRTVDFGFVAFSTPNPTDQAAWDADQPSRDAAVDEFNRFQLSRLLEMAPPPGHPNHQLMIDLITRYGVSR